MWRLLALKGKARLALSEQADDSPALIRGLKSLGLLELTPAAREADASRVEPITRAFEQKQGLPLIRRATPLVHALGVSKATKR
jgi:hypothetical protein